MSMSPAEQIAANRAMHDKIPYLIDLLAVWEAVDEATAHDPISNGPAKGAIPALYQLRQDVGTAELRDLCITMHTPLQACYLSWTAKYGEFDAAWDWEWVPAYVAAVDWTKVFYNSQPYHQVFGHLPTAEEVNAKLDEPREPIQQPELDLDEVFLNNDEGINTDRIVATYGAADPKARKAIDDIFISLTGWSLETLIEKGTNP